MSLFKTLYRNVKSKNPHGSKTNILSSHSADSNKQSRPKIKRNTTRASSSYLTSFFLSKPSSDSSWICLTILFTTSVLTILVVSTRSLFPVGESFSSAILGNWLEFDTFIEITCSFASAFVSDSEVQLSGYVVWAILSRGCTLTTLLARGEIDGLLSAERGWRRSGLNARRNRGDPGSADFGRP